MSIREIDIAQFSEFAREQIQSGTDASLTSLAEQWERRQQSNIRSSIGEHPKPQVTRARARVEDLAHQQGVTPIRSAADLRFEFLESDAELDDFLSAVQAGRKEYTVRDPLNVTPKSS